MPQEVRCSYYVPVCFNALYFQKRAITQIVPNGICTMPFLPITPFLFFCTVVTYSPHLSDGLSLGLAFLGPKIKSNSRKILPVQIDTLSVCIDRLVMFYLIVLISRLIWQKMKKLKSKDLFYYTNASKYSTPPQS